MAKVRPGLLCMVVVLLVEPGDRAIAEDSPRRVARPTKHINERIAASWAASQLMPADPVTDLEFLRRISLDLIGRIPTVQEIVDYEKDRLPDKRARLVERLLGGDGHAEFWSRLWITWLQGEALPPIYQDQLRGWLKGQLASNVSHKDLATALLTATGKSTENGAVHFVLMHAGRPLPAELAQRDGQFDVVPLTKHTVRLFLGTQIQCAECHCHPFNAEVKQKHFWGINTFFRQIERKVGPQGKNEPPVLELADNREFNKNAIILFEKRNGVFLTAEAMFLDNSRLPRTHAGTRRAALAEHICRHPDFARAYVNRLWGHFFGRGLNELPAVDDFGEHNPVIHPELLDQLAKDFIACGYDTRQLIHWICASDAYQLKSAVNATNENEETAVFFSRMALKPINFDQLFDSVLTATRLTASLSADERKQMRQHWRKEVIVHCDDDKGEPTFLDGEPDPFRQMMMLMTSKEINRAINNPKTGPIDKSLLQEKPERIIDALYLATLSRHPTVKEIAQIQNHVRTVQGKGGDLAALWQDVFWSLLNSSEFVLNH